MTNDILIVGAGVVGSNLANELRRLSPDVYDKEKHERNRITRTTYDLIFICVDTPYTREDPNNMTQVVEAISENQRRLKGDGVFVIKSTVLPYRAHLLRKVFRERIVFSPEFYGDTPSSKDVHFDFTILGGDKADCIKVQRILQNRYTGSHSFKIVSPELACLAKYMENAFLATKVSFCAQFFEICKEMDVNYEELRELFILDPRVGASHTFIHSDSPYWDSHCLNKDVAAIAEAANNNAFLDSLIDWNDKQKNRYSKHKNRRTKRDAVTKRYSDSISMVFASPDYAEQKAALGSIH